MHPFCVPLVTVVACSLSRVRAQNTAYSANAGVHPRLLCEGIELAKTAVLEFVDNMKIKKDTLDRDLLIQIARASLRTKM